MPPFSLVYQMPNYRRYYGYNQPVFLTIVTHQRTPWLAAEDNIYLLFDAMRRVKARYPFRHLAHVILPDHLHWMLLPDGQMNFSRIVAAVKRDTTWRLRERGYGPTPLWQSRFYDHLIRDNADFARHLDYIHYNPVRHGLAQFAAAYPYSSFQAWLERQFYTPDWGTIDQLPTSINTMDLE